MSFQTPFCLVITLCLSFNCQHCIQLFDKRLPISSCGMVEYINTLHIDIVVQACDMDRKAVRNYQGHALLSPAQFGRKPL